MRLTTMLAGFCAAAALASTGAYAASGSIEEFLRIDPSPQSSALGSSILSLADSPLEMTVNPAALSTLSRIKAGYSEFTLSPDIHYRYMGVGIPTKGGSWGISAAYADYEKATSISRDGFDYSPVARYEGMLCLNYAYAFKEDFPVFQERGGIGINVKYLGGEMEGVTGNTVAFDFGGIYNVPFADGLSCAVVYKNAGNPLQYGDRSFDLPASLNFGLRYARRSWANLILTADAANDIDKGYLAGGLSVMPLYPFTLRLGWRDNGSAATPNLRAGLGVDAGDVNLDYAVAAFQGLPVEHHFGVSLAFGAFLQRKTAYDYYLNYYFQMGKEKFQAQDYIAARQYFEDVLSVYPNHQASKEYLERISQQLDIIEHQKEIAANNWIRKGEVALAKGDIFAARNYYDYVLNIDPENRQALDAQEKIGDLLSDYQYQRIQEDSKERLMELWNKGVENYSKGNYVVAKGYFQEILRLTPNNEAAAKYVEGIDLQLRRVNQLQAQNMYARGMEEYRKGDFAEAAKYFSAVAVAAPDNGEAKSRLAECEAILKDEQEKTQQEKMIDEDTKVKAIVDESYGKAEKLFENGDYEGAMKAYLKAKAVAERYNNDDFVQQARNGYSQARSALSERHYKIGYAYSKKSNLEAAAFEYKKALEVNPEYAVAKIELEHISETLAQRFYEQGMKEFSNGDMERSRELFQKSLYYKPDKVESLRALERMK